MAYAVYGEDSMALGDPRESYELFARDVLGPEGATSSSSGTG